MQITLSYIKIAHTGKLNPFDSVFLMWGIVALQDSCNSKKFTVIFLFRLLKTGRKFVFGVFKLFGFPRKVRFHK